MNQPTRWQSLQQALLSPSALASAIEAGLGWRFPAMIIATTIIAVNFIGLPLFLKALPQMAPPGLSPDMMAGFERTSSVMRPIQIVLAPLGWAAWWLMLTALLSLTSLLLNRRSSFRNFFVLTVHASLVPLLEFIARNLVLWLRYASTGHIVLDPPIGLDVLIQPQSAALAALLQHVNLFEVWFLAILIVGVRVLCRCATWVAAAIVLPAWGLWLLAHVVYATAREVLIRQLGA